MIQTSHLTDALAKMNLEDFEATLPGEEIDVYNFR